MKKKTFLFNGDVFKATEFCKKTLFEYAQKEKECLITIAEPSKDISPEQRGLYWIWMTKVGEVIGDTKDYYHMEFKKMFLVNIFRRDKPEYEAMIQAWLSLKKGADESQVQTIGEWILKHTSIMNAEVPQMAEYMRDIKHYCSTTLDIQLPLPDDRLLNIKQKGRNTDV